MSTGLYRLLWRRFGGMGTSAAPRASKSGVALKSALIGLAALAILLFGTVGWLVMSVDDSESADGTVAQSTGRSTGDDSGASATASEPPPETSESEARHASLGEGRADVAKPAAVDDKSTAAVEPSPLEGLKISSQSWRRGGLGSKALVTFTLRNNNPYAVKDVEIACAFRRRDGTHLTDRRRVIPGEVDKRGRKTFTAVHVGFVNVNASKASCTLVAASKS